MHHSDIKPSLLCWVAAKVRLKPRSRLPMSSTINEAVCVPMCVATHIHHFILRSKLKCLSGRLRLKFYNPTLWTDWKVSVQEHEFIGNKDFTLTSTVNCTADDYTYRFVSPPCVVALNQNYRLYLFLWWGLGQKRSQTWSHKPLVLC